MIGQSLTSFKFYQKTIKHGETIIFDRQTFFPQTFNLGILGYFDKKKNYFYFGGNLEKVVYKDRKNYTSIARKLWSLGLDPTGETQEK